MFDMNIIFQVQKDAAFFSTLGLGDIVDILSTIASAAAAIVAIYAVIQTKKQMLISVKMHEQITGIELFDRRMRILSDINNEKRIDETELSVVFQENKKILDLYKKMKDDKQCLDRAKGKKRDYFRYMANENPELENQMRSYESSLLSLEQGDISEYRDKEREFFDFCERNSITIPIGNGDEEYYNYLEITETIFNAEKSLIEDKQKLVKAIECFIKEPMKPIGSKEEERS